MKTHLDRRSFLKASAAAAAVVSFPTLIPAPALGQAGSPNAKISIGCIGVGGMGTGNMKNFLALKDACRVVAVCDAQRDRMQRAKGIVDAAYGDEGCAMLGDWRDVLARPDIDAVMIATQDHWHALIATAAAAAGKDMYCEKPMGVSIDEGKAIRAAVRKHKRIFQAGTWQRSQGKFRQACELVRNGHIGRLLEIQVASPGPNYQPKYEGSLDPQDPPEGFDWAMWRGPAPDKPFNPGRVAFPDWYLIWDYCAGFICNWGVHHLDIAHWGCPSIAEKPCEVECSGVFRDKGFADNIESWKATFTFPGGLKMVFTDMKQQKNGAKFIGEKGWIHVDRSGFWAEPNNLLAIAPKDGDVRIFETDPAADVKKVKTKDGEQIAYPSLNHGEVFLNSIRTRRDPISDVDATHVASYLGLVADIAARMETKLTWDPKREQFKGNDEANKLLSRPMHNGWRLDA